jgi:hypothetical protein
MTRAAIFRLLLIVGAFAALGGCQARTVVKGGHAEVASTTTTTKIKVDAPPPPPTVKIRIGPRRWPEPGRTTWNPPPEPK